MENIAFQPEFRPALPPVYGAKDYRDFRDTLTEMDRILVESGIEDEFVRHHLAEHVDTVSERKLGFLAKKIRKALRHDILLTLSGLSVREFSAKLPDSRLFQWFTGTEQIDGVRPVSKSTVARFEKMFEEGEVERLIHELNRAVMGAEGSQKLLLCETPPSFDQIFADTTCIEANIHFPVDWVLLRDAVRTLVKAVSLIRAQGLVNRMSEPCTFMKQMNQLCIQMTHARRKTDSKKVRKAVLRKMKKLAAIVSFHAEKHRDLLLAKRDKTEWSEAQAAQVISRLANVIEQLPDAIHQAHERLIGERKLDNAEKILSLYEPDVHVIVRGKAGADVEFGNALYLAEQEDGLIVDWALMQNQPASDSSLVRKSLARIETNYGKPSGFSTDRGFHSKANSAHLEAAGIFNAICPKSVQELQERLEEDERFRQMQTRRASTEARVAILTNNYVGAPLRSKGFKNRNTRIGWCILVHNLWKLAAMAAERRREILKAQAA